jgi:hypothetical protein
MSLQDYLGGVLCSSTVVRSMCRLILFFCCAALFLRVYLVVFLKGVWQSLLRRIIVQRYCGGVLWNMSWEHELCGITKNEHSAALLRKLYSTVYIIILCCITGEEYCAALLGRSIVQHY